MKQSKLKEEHRQEVEIYRRMHQSLVDFNRMRKENPQAANVSHILQAYPPLVLKTKILAQFQKIQVLEKQMKKERNSYLIKTSLILGFSTALIALSFYF